MRQRPMQLLSRSDTIHLSACKPSFIPATMAAYIGVPQEESDAVAGLINFVCNIGSGMEFPRSPRPSPDALNPIRPCSPAILARQPHLSELYIFVCRIGYSCPRSQAHAGAWGHLYGVMLARASALSYLDTFGSSALLRASCF